MPTRESAMDALRAVQDPELHRSIVDLNMVEDILLDGDSITAKIKLTIPACPLKNKINQDVTEALAKLEGVGRVKVEFGAMTPDERVNLRKQILGDAKDDTVPHIADKLIAISSGKGGVGKSTVTANLARAFAESGMKVGVLDADVYGFSIPRMLGVNVQPTLIDDMIVPAISDGIKVVSMGFFVPDDSPVVWRGPLLHKAITQFMTDVAWGDIDLLLLDLPPGTGDVTITIAQKLPKAQLVVVTTPQPAAAHVASRVAAMAEKTNLSVLGVIENMSYYVLPDKSREYVFGRDGGRVLARKVNAEFLGEIPLDKRIREAADTGSSLFEAKVADDIAEIYRRIKANILQLI
jgi:ATP-binding protein involved in chromosome partitioning